MIPRGGSFFPFVYLPIRTFDTAAKISICSKPVNEKPGFPNPHMGTIGNSHLVLHCFCAYYCVNDVFALKNRMSLVGHPRLFVSLAMGGDFTLSVTGRLRYLL
ncbi:MAG: hypothetical protein JEZ11_08410 [Desulfobacterales bacterium]|nr:hypothetical protein [Desulfobacterales bacterium]